MKTNRRSAGALFAAASFAGALLVPLATPAQAAEVDLEAHMRATTAFPNAGGSAEYESDSSGREFDISIYGIKSLAGKTVTVGVHGSYLGRMTVGSLGRAHLYMRSGVFRMYAGDVVRVRTGAGSLVTYGTLHRDLDD